MIEGVINSEAPQEHWAHLSGTGKRILDLGCGFWTQAERDEGNGTTRFFSSHNPASYVGVDHNSNDIQKLRAEFPSHKFIDKTIICADDIKAIVQEERPSLVKCDIEGMERYLFQLEERFSICEIGIETHSGELEAQCLDWLNKVGLVPWRIDSASFCPEIKIIYGKC